MPDGGLMRAHAGTDRKPLSIEEGIVRLEAGQGEGIIVDLGDGRLAAADGPRGTEGLLQRLRGHKMILALASGSADLSRFSSASRQMVIAPLVQEILDATRHRS